MALQETVVVTTPTLAAPAMRILEARGLRLVFLPLSTSPAALAQILARENPAGIVSRAIALDAKAITAAPALRVISKYGVGYDNVDIAAAAGRDVPVLITRGANSQSVAELAIGLTIALARNIPVMDREIRAGQWIRTINRGIELAGLTLGLVGHGSIGSRVGYIAHALGMKVHAYDPYLNAGRRPSTVTMEKSLDALLSCSDVVSLHCPLTDETRCLLDERRLALLKPGTMVVNTARGEVVDDDALVASLQKGHIRGYAADTYSVEPPAPDNPLLALENVILSPHCGAATHAAADRVATAVARNLILGLDGFGWKSENVVNTPPANTIR